MMQLADDIGKKDDFKKVTYSGHYCSAKFQRCMVLSAYFIALLILIMQLLRSIAKDNDIAALVESMKASILNGTFFKS